MKKKVIILGAGIYQVPLIKKARENGLYTVVCSIPGRYPGFRFADKVYYVDTTDKIKMLEIAKNEHISAILTTGTDSAVRTVGYVCQKLGLTGINALSAKWATDKYLMKQRFAAAGVRTAPFYRISNLEQAEKACDQLGFPVIFKCVDKSGSRGIIKINDVDKIESAFRYCMSCTERSYILIERFINGSEIGLDGYIDRESGTRFFIPHNKILYNNGYTNVPIGHILPFQCSTVVWNDLMYQAEKAVDSLELDKSFFNMDILISEGKSYILEIGARAGGTCIPELLSLYLSCDYYQMMLDNALGGKIPLQLPVTVTHACISKIIVSKKAGTLKSVFLPVKDLHSGEQISLDYQIGERIPKFKTGTDRIGQIILSADNESNTFERLLKIEKKVCLTVQ